MESLQIIFQVLSAIVIILAIFQKEKWRMMMFYTISNLLSCGMYFTFGRTASAYICLVATLRTLVYMYYAYKKIKPNIIWLIAFETAFVVTTILTWQDALDLIPLFAFITVGYGSWQDNQSVLRVTYIIEGVLYIIYKSIIGAYIAMSVEAIKTICTIIGFVYYCTLKKQTPIFQLIFKKKIKQADNTQIVEIEKIDSVEE